MASVLDSIPGLGGYLGMRNQLQGDRMAQMQQLQALGGLLGQFQTQELQAQQLKMAQQKAAKEQMFMDLAMRSMGPQQDPRAIPALAAGAQGEGPTVAAADRMAAMPMPAGTKQGPDLGLIQALSMLNPAAGTALLKVHQEMNPGLKIENGVALNPRMLQHGQIVPQVRVGQTGEASYITTTPNGGAQMAPVPGSLPTYRAFQDERNQSQAATDLVVVPPTGPNSAPRYASRAELLGQQPQAPAVSGQNPPTSAAPTAAAPTTGAVPNFRTAGAGQTPNTRTQILSQELASEQAAFQDAERRGDIGASAIARRNIANLETEIGKASAGAPRNAAGMSPAQQNETGAQAEGRKQLYQDNTKRFGEFDASIRSLNNVSRTLERLLALSNSGQTFSNAGAGFKSQLSSIGQALGIEINVDRLAQSEAYQAQIAELLKQRLGSKDYGSGSGVSNLDIIAASAPLPELVRSPQGQKQIIAALAQDTKESIADMQAYRDYYQRRMGNMDGFKYPSETVAQERLQRIQSMQPKPEAGTNRKPPPAVGSVVSGYRFKGGDPSKPESWEKQ